MRSIAVKLTLAFLGVSLLGVAIIAILAGRFTADVFWDFVDTETQQSLIAELQDYYRDHNGWGGIGAMRIGERGFPQRWMRRKFVVLDEKGEPVAPLGGQFPPPALSQSEILAGKPIEVDGQIVGTLIPIGPLAGIAAPRAAFLDRINRNLLSAGIGAAVVSLLLGILLARTISRPLREMTAATRAVAGGDLEQVVPIRSRDELGELAEAFNVMNANLARSRDIRRQMTADIAHELRTPLSVILGHAEALSGGDLPPTQETFHVIHEEAVRLSRMVDDLRLLSLSDAGELPIEKQPLEPRELLERAIASHGPRYQQEEKSLRLQLASELRPILADKDRLLQVLDNLLANALRHCPLRGEVVLTAQASPEGLRVEVWNDGPGIPDEELNRIFDRFYRLDKSRDREHGGSGLGLAIAKSIVEGHGGRIWAESQPGEGVTIILELPADGGVPHLDPESERQD